VSDLVSHSALLCERFYNLKDLPGKGSSRFPPVIPGQIVLAHFVYHNTQPWVAEVIGVESASVSYKIKQFNALHPTKPHFPIKEMNLRADENIYLLKGKERPGVILQTIETDFHNALHPEPYATVIPLYTFKDRHDQPYRVRVAAFESPNLFYLPSAHEGIHEESVLRFEHTQPVTIAGLRPYFVDGKGSFLTNEAWTLLQHWYHQFLTGRVLDVSLQDHIDAYRPLLLEAFALK